MRKLIRSSRKERLQRQRWHRLQQHQSKLTANATLEPYPPVNVAQTMTVFITRCQKVEIARTCLSVCQQHHPTTTSAKKIAEKCRELYAVWILGALISIYSSERQLQHHTDFWLVIMKPSPFVSVALMALAMIIIIYQKVEIALNWKQHTATGVRNLVARKCEHYAGTLVLATTNMSSQPNVFPKRATMSPPNHSVSVARIIIQCQKVEIAWRFLNSCQHHPPTGLDPVVCKCELYANALNGRNR